MKLFQRLFLIILIAYAGQSIADTCPRIQEINVYKAPPGWTYLIPPDQLYPMPDLTEYQFSSAIHSLNGGFYFMHVICRYEVCPSYLCPAFTLLSDQLYSQPYDATPPWDHRSVIRFTVTCMPGNHDPATCQFQ